MSEHAQLLLPDPPLAGCLFAAILRDTRGVTLSDADRFNHFPASPLIGLTITAQGESRLMDRTAPAATGTAPALGRLAVSGPQTRPISSWNPGPVLALSVGLYPDAWAALTGQSARALTDRFTVDIPAPFNDLFDRILQTDDLVSLWHSFQQALLPHWQACQTDTVVPYKHRLSNWGRAVITRTALSGPGRSLRAAERRLRRLSGQNRRSLDFYAAIEDLHARVTRDPAATPTDVAHAAGYADQSHMGRAVKRATGFSPARLNHLIDTDEAFWCYRILGERF